MVADTVKYGSCIGFWLVFQTLLVITMYYVSFRQRFLLHPWQHVNMEGGHREPIWVPSKAHGNACRSWPVPVSDVPSLLCRLSWLERWLKVSRGIHADIYGIHCNCPLHCSWHRLVLTHHQRQVKTKADTRWPRTSRKHHPRDTQLQIWAMPRILDIRASRQTKEGGQPRQ